MPLAPAETRRRVAPSRAKSALKAATRLVVSASTSLVILPGVEPKKRMVKIRSCWARWVPH